jgi:hypothetical protein
MRAVKFGIGQPVTRPEHVWVGRAEAAASATELA